MWKGYKKEREVAGKKISLETGKVARQADGAIIATCGETVILATVVGAKKVKIERNERNERNERKEMEMKCLKYTRKKLK